MSKQRQILGNESTTTKKNNVVNSIAELVSLFAQPGGGGLLQNYKTRTKNEYGPLILGSWKTNTAQVRSLDNKEESNLG